MRLFLLTAFTMLAFAANSLLNRAALVGGSIDPASFALIRVASGVAVLFVLLGMKNAWGFRQPNSKSILGLSAYLLGFSYAYLSMDAGIGALILFAGVQVTMFAGALRAGEPLPVTRWIGALAAFIGLVLLLWPQEGISLSLGGFALMSIAAVGWGIYSLVGRGATDPLAATAWNFLYSLPIVAMFWLWGGTPVSVQIYGVVLAIASGALTSGLGYALWYAVLPKLGASLGALAQLSVPVIALGLGALLLGEVVVGRTVIAAMIVLAGIAVGFLKAPEKQKLKG